MQSLPAFKVGHRVHIIDSAITLLIHPEKINKYT